MNRALAAVARTGVRALLVHALHQPAKRLDVRYGGQPAPVHALTLMLRARA